MPVYSLEGTPGSGKTLYCVQKLIPDFIKIRGVDGSLVPRHIYTNIEGLRPEILCALIGVDGEAIASYFHVLGQAVDENGCVYEDKDLVRYFYYEPWSIEWVVEKDERGRAVKVPDTSKAVPIPYNSMVIIDELQNYFGGRDFNTLYSKACVDYLTKNRHYGWTIWWASQSVESVDITFRRNTQYVHFLEKKEIYGFKNSASVKHYEGWLAGDKTSTPPFAVKSFHYDKRFYKTYNSYVAAGVLEKRYISNVFLAHKGFMLMVVLFLLCVVGVIFMKPLDTLSGKNRHRPAKPANAQAAPAQSFSGAGAAGAVEPIVSSSSQGVVCISNSYRHGGIDYVVIGGMVEPKKAGVEYAKCSD